MKGIACAALTALLLGTTPIACAAAQSTIPLGKGQNPQTIRRLLRKFFAAKATGPFRYPMACVGGDAEMYVRMALRAGLHATGKVQLHLWTVPEQFQPVAHLQPVRKSGRCDYRIASEGASAAAHFVADFFSRKRPKTNQIAYAKVWQQGQHKAVLVTFPAGPRGFHPHITFQSVPVDTQPGVKQ